LPLSLPLPLASKRRAAVATRPTVRRLRVRVLPLAVPAASLVSAPCVSSDLVSDPASASASASASDFYFYPFTIRNTLGSAHASNPVIVPNDLQLLAPRDRLLTSVSHLTVPCKGRISGTPSIARRASLALSRYPGSGNTRARRRSARPGAAAAGAPDAGSRRGNPCSST